MEIAAYITVNLLLFSSWHVILFRHKNSLSFVDRLLGVFILGLAQIVITEMVLGVAFKQLFAAPLFIVNIFISLAVLTLACRKRRPDPGHLSSMTDRGIRGLPAEIVKEMKDKAIQFVHLITSDRVLLAVFSLFIIYFIYLLLSGYLFPSHGWDALLYHLPTVGFILQSGAIENIPYNSLIYTFINVFPKNIDLFFLWNIIFLKSDVIVDLSQLPFTGAGMIAIYGMSRKLGTKEKFSAYASLLFFFAPVIMLQSTTNYVDIAVSVLFLIAMNFILATRVSSINLSPAERSGTSWYRGNSALLLAGIATGILLGSKGSGPVFIFALTGIYAMNIIRIRFFSGDKENAGDVRGSFRLSGIVLQYALYFILPVIMLGSYWYINNWVYYGNPVYPFIVKIFGNVVFSGTLSEMLHTGPEFLQQMSPLQRPLYSWLERVEYYHYASDISGFGPLWFLLLLPCTVFSIFLSIWRKKFDFLIVAVMMILIFLVYPNNWFTRYVIFLFGLGCLAYGLVVQFFEKKGRTVEVLVLFIVLYTFLASHSQTVTPGKIKEFVHLPAGERSIARLESSVLDKSQQKSYGLWSWVSKNVSEGDTLAYTFTPEMISPLWIRSFTSKIAFVKGGKFEDWLENLEEHDAAYIVVLLNPRSIEYAWLLRLRELRNDPKWSSVADKFILKYYDDNYAVFRFYG